MIPAFDFVTQVRNFLLAEVAVDDRSSVQAPSRQSAPQFSPLLPAGVAAVESTTTVSDATLTVTERALVASAVPDRVREIATGRWCARQALSKLGIVGFSLLADPSRPPIWPEGIGRKRYPRERILSSANTSSGKSGSTSPSVRVTVEGDRWRVSRASIGSLDWIHDSFSSRFAFANQRLHTSMVVRAAR